MAHGLPAGRDLGFQRNYEDHGFVDWFMTAAIAGHPTATANIERYGATFVYFYQDLQINIPLLAS
jgi:hypothetical protein